MSPALTRRSACAGLLATAGAARAAPPATRIASTDPRLQYEGRTAVTAPGVTTLAYPGIVLRFEAACARAALRCRSTNADAFIDIAVDGGAPRMVRLAAGEQVIALAEGPFARRRFEITRRTAPWMSLMEVVGLELEGPAPALHTPPPLPPRRLLFVGDSITCGSNDDWPDLAAPEGPQHENARLSYGAELARRLKAQRHLVAYGGRGVIRDWRGLHTTNNAPEFYPLALPDDPAWPWDARRYTPDAVGVCLGTNDFAVGAPDREAFVGAYVALLARIRADAPRAQVFVIDSPMVVDDPAFGPKRTTLNAYLDETVARAASPLVTRAHLRHYPGRPGKDAHPIADQHQAIATELEPLFRSAPARA